MRSRRFMGNFPCRRFGNNGPQGRQSRALIICPPKPLAHFCLLNIDRYIRVAPRVGHVSKGLLVRRARCRGWPLPLMAPAFTCWQESARLIATLPQRDVLRAHEALGARHWRATLGRGLWPRNIG